MNLDIHSPLPQRTDWRIGCIGSGFIMKDCHLVAYGKVGFNPVAIASRTRDNAATCAEQRGVPTVYETIDQLLDDESIEVLDIAVPPDNQLALIEAACQRGTVKGILAQKPLGADYAEAVAAVETCEQAGIVLAVNQNMRYDQSVRAAKTLLANGTIGEPVLATVDMRGIPHWMPWQERQGWVTLRIMSIHHIDTFRYWFGDPERIYCSVRTDPRTTFWNTPMDFVVLPSTTRGPAPLAKERRPISVSSGASKGSTDWPWARSAGARIRTPLPRQSAMPPRVTTVFKRLSGRKAGSPTRSSARWRSC
jgi:predicted dehydrogenase